MHLIERKYDNMEQVRKHVFYIQNYTTYIAANSIITSQNLPLENCHFLFGRGFKLFSNIVSFSELSPYNIKYKLAFWKSWKKLYQYKKEIKKIILNSLDKDYIFYFPLTNFYAVRMIADHKKCVSINAIEDGASAYWSKTERKRIIFKSTFISFAYSIKIFFNHYFTYLPINIISYHRYYNRYDKYFTLGEDGFIGYKNRIILKAEINNKPPEEYLNIKYVYAPAALVEKNIVKKEAFKNSLRVLFSKIIKINSEKSKSFKVHYRFHPLTSSSKQNLKEYKDVLNEFSEIEFVEIPKEYSLEDILYYNNATLISDISSLSLYAKSFNKKILIYNDIVLSHDKNFIKEINIQPKSMKKIFLEDSLSSISSFD